MTRSLLTRLGCYLSGHDYTIKRADGRMFLYCGSCGHRSGGVMLGDGPIAAGSGRARYVSETRPASAVRREHIAAH